MAAMTGVLVKAAEYLAEKPRVFIPKERWQHFHNVEALHLADNKGKVFLGAECVTYNKGNKSTRYLCEGTKETVGGNEYPISELELRAEYMRQCSMGERARWSNADVAAEARTGWHVPHYRAEVVPEDGLVTLDLKKAYLQIFKNFSTQVEYNREKGVWAAAGHPWQDLEELAKHRKLYSSICSHAWRARRTGVYYRGELTQDAHDSPFYQPQAAALMCDILNAVAQEMVGRFGAYMVWTDSYTIDADRADEANGYLLERWGLETATKPNPAGNMVNVQDGIYDQSDQKRQELAWLLSGTGPEDGPLTVYMAEKRWNYKVEPSAPAIGTSYHRQHRLDPAKAIKCAPRPRRTSFMRALERRAKQARSAPYAPLCHFQHEGVAVYFGDGEVSLPENPLLGMMAELAAKLRAPP